MRRDWELVRRIMLRVEERNHEEREVTSADFKPTDEALAAYNMQLLVEAGLAEGGGRFDMVNAPPYAYILRLTWPGHELLDDIRGETAWTRIKTVAKDKGIDLTIDSIKVLAKVVVEHLLRGG